jgi:hypothetical protein
MDIDRHEANPVKVAADEVESGNEKIDAALIRAHMQNVNSEKGERMGKLLKMIKPFQEAVIALLRDASIQSATLE